MPVGTDVVVPSCEPGAGSLSRVADVRTDLTEIVTGLGTLGFPDAEHAVAAAPRALLGVDPAVLERVGVHLDDPKFAALARTAFANGAAFLSATEALRGRVPHRVEWKGPHKPPGFETVPADLRIDHVYLVSCKYGSDILHNVSPAHLIDRHLAQKRRHATVDWFAEVAPEAYVDLYRHTLSWSGLDLPAEVAQLDRDQRRGLRAALPPGRWPDELAEEYRSFVGEVARASAQRWSDAITTPAQREELLWRLLRLQSAPYFVLGQSRSGEPLRYRVDTPWDFRRRYELESFEVFAEPAGQAVVRWRAVVRVRPDAPDPPRPAPEGLPFEPADDRRTVEGRVELRWSHGKFSGNPEAKVYLATPPHDVPGYTPLLSPA